MTETTQTVFEKHQIRKSYAQKSAFIQYVQNTAAKLGKIKTVLQIVDDEDVGKFKRVFICDVKNGEWMRFALSLARIPTVNGIGSGVEIYFPVAQDVFAFRMIGRQLNYFMQCFY